jgi:hypothetical protein
MSFSFHRVQFSAEPLFPATLTKLGEPVRSIQRLRVNFGVLSISQPEERASQRESPVFIGFYRCFLEVCQNGVEACAYL